MPDTPLICHECWAQKPNHYEPCPHTMGLVNHFHEQLKQKDLQIDEYRKRVQQLKEAYEGMKFVAVERDKAADARFKELEETNRLLSEHQEFVRKVAVAGPCQDCEVCTMNYDEAKRLHSGKPSDIFQRRDRTCTYCFNSSKGTGECSECGSK